MDSQLIYPRQVGPDNEHFTFLLRAKIQSLISVRIWHLSTTAAAKQLFRRSLRGQGCRHGGVPRWRCLSQRSNEAIINQIH